MTRFIDDYLLYLLSHASTKASAGFHAQLSDLGLPVSTWRILSSLYPDAPSGVNALADACLTKQSTMTRQIDRLEKAGLVTRDSEGKDRRRVTVWLTIKGHMLAHELTAKAKAQEAEVLAGLTSEEITALKAALAKLTKDKDH